MGMGIAGIMQSRQGRLLAGELEVLHAAAGERVAFPDAKGHAKDLAIGRYPEMVDIGPEIADPLLHVSTQGVQQQKGGRHGSQQQQPRSEEHTSELQSLMRISYAVFCLKKKTI